MASATISRPNTREKVLSTSRGDYLVQVAWPAKWKADGSTDDTDAASVPILYVLDGNAYFHTAVDIVRRHEVLWGRRAVVVGVGYPPASPDGPAIVYCAPRRARDYTPMGTDGPAYIEPEWARHGITAVGEADQFLTETLRGAVFPAVARDLLPHLPVADMPRALFGHSFGGLFTMFALYAGGLGHATPGVVQDDETTPAFDFAYYFGASPSVFFNNDSLVRDYETPFRERATPAPAQSGVSGLPRVLVTMGGLESVATRFPGEDSDAFEARRRKMAETRAVGKARDTAQRLQAVAGGRADGDGDARKRLLAAVEYQEYPDEEHAGASVVALQRAIDRLLGGTRWPGEEQ
ncbi:hypothetical protein SCUCBS95973_006430 [Sporothrix curviconia]|uniref:Alpha/beta hydrolase n=1 Tax=Sporothrix curviconia TaxID=1260050 RepID=A0ABP0C7H5_9PEZI